MTDHFLCAQLHMATLRLRLSGGGSACVFTGLDTDVFALAFAVGLGAASTEVAFMGAGLESCKY